jgi:hypothetical protein
MNEAERRRRREAEEEARERQAKALATAIAHGTCSGEPQQPVGAQIVIRSTAHPHASGAKGRRHQGSELEGPGLRPRLRDYEGAKIQTTTATGR